jgi:hypothetical protein
MKFNLNEDGSKYMRFIAWNQIWFRSSQMNRNDWRTNFYRDRHWKQTFALSSVLANIKRYMIVTHFGINNQTLPMEEPQDLLELVGMEPEKNQEYFPRCLERIRLSFT